MAELPETLDMDDDPHPADARAVAPTPGLVWVFSGARPLAVPIALRDGSLELGRADHPNLAADPDPRISRRHARVRHDGQHFTITDLGSRNGTVVDGEPLASGATRRLSRVLRLGCSLLVPLPDIGPLQRLGVRVEHGRVAGPALQQALQQVAAAAQSATLHINGESGAGKEELARAFHAAGPTAGGPFEALNCAAIPEGIAERLLFGAKRGAYSGADADAIGHIQAASGGTLFLDEISELSLPVQAKLLRVLETGEVVPLGAVRPSRVQLRFCSATHRNLRAQVAAGELREDLYFRLATPQVKVSPLRTRPEEIPWLLREVLGRAGVDCTPHHSLVEACLLRQWPGNFRELIHEAHSAAQVARAAGTSVVEAHHLSPDAGSAFSPAAPASPPPARAAAFTPPSITRLTGVLQQCEGNVSAAARELGVHRTQLQRWLARLGLDARTFQ